MNILINKQYLKDHQYQNPHNLSSRRQLLDYGANPKPLWKWVAEHYLFQENDKILEVGCGSGDFWQEVVKGLPCNCDITLTDFSVGMLENAKENLEGSYDFKFEIADVESLSYENRSFDRVIAHFVLYHADSIECALKEIRRVLKISGFAGILVSAENNMSSLFKLIECENPRQAVRFSAEKAIVMLPKYFSQISQYIYQNTLSISEVDPLISYIKSFSGMDKKDDNFYSHCKQILAHHIRQKGHLLFQTTRHLFLVS